MLLSKCLGRLAATESTTLAAFRRYSRVSSLEPLSDQKFFNREAEKTYLSSLFEAEPSSVSVVLGGPSTGKTALLHKVLCDANKFRVVHFDLRTEVFMDWRSLHDSLLTKFQSLFPELKNKLPNVELSVMDSVSVKLQRPVQPYAPASLKQFKELLNTIAQELPSWTFWGGTSTKPVLFIDEANVLHVLERSKNEEDREALEALLRWSVAMTKQHQKFHVVLASSDSFFWEWLARPELNIQSHSEAIVIGDLVRSEAQKFFDRECERLGIDDISFERIYEQTGGRILHINRWLEYYKRVGRKIIDSPWPMVSAQRYVLMRDFYNPKEDVLRKIMEDIAHRGFLPFESVLSSENIVRDLVRRNIIGLRPKRALVADIEGDIPDAPHLVPRMPVDRFVLREILGRLQ